MNILVENTDGNYQNRVEYVVDFINGHPLCPKSVLISTQIKNNDLKIQYGGNTPENNFFIPTQATIFSEVIIESSMLYANKYLINEREVYSVELEHKKQSEFIVEKKFQFDLIETIFFHLSRYEEFHCKNQGKDRWDMMNESDQFLVVHKLEKQPIVDHLVKCFLESIGVLIPKQKSKIRITHDIDLITKFKSPLSFLRFNAYYIKNWKGLNPIRQLWASYSRSVFKNEKAYDVFDNMLLKNPGEKEIYFLIGGKTAVDTPLDTKTEIFKNAVKQSKERGYNIGIHPSYATWKDLNLFKSEKERLEQIIDEEIIISRQHYLHFSFDATIEILQSAGIKQDSTLGYNRRIGFRAGTGVGFKLFDLKSDTITEIIEKPLSFMDSSLFEESGFKPEKFTGIAKEFIQSNEYDSEITCNFHNSRFDDAKMYGLPQQELYNKLTDG